MGVFTGYGVGNMAVGIGLRVTPGVGVTPGGSVRVGVGVPVITGRLPVTIGVSGVGVKADASVSWAS